MGETSKPAEHLRTLHEEEASGELKRPDILVVEGVDMVRALIVRHMQELFPDYNILAVADGGEATTKISEELRDSLALVFADTADWHAVIQLLFGLREPKKALCIANHGKKVPVVLTSASVSEDEVADQSSFEGKVLGKALERGDLDGFVEKPFAKEQLAAVLADSIAKRAGLFEEAEKMAREHALADFIEYYNDLVQAWEANLESLIETAAGAVREDWNYLLGGVASFKATLASMRVDIDYKTLRKLIHDMNNAMTVLISFSAYLLEGEVTGSTEEALTVFKAEVRKLNSDVDLIGRANRGDISWASADQPKLAPEPEQVLRCLAGTRFCVIDDNKNIRNVCERVISDAGGNLVMTIAGRDELMALVDSDSVNTPVDVFILDHELGGELYGHDLVETIYRHYPGALIIAHTGKADDLNKDADNPYRRLGIEIIGKRQWNALSGILRRKFNKGGDAE